MLLMLQGEKMGSANPSGLVSLLPGGAGVQNTGTAYVPFLNAPIIEPIVREFSDASTDGSGNASVAAAGNYVVQRFVSNTGGASYGLPLAQPSVGVLPRWSQGVVIQAAGANGSNGLVMLDGVCNALCTTGSIAIAAGTFLTSDGLGNLTPFAAPAAAPTPTVTPVGTTGSTAYGYKLVAVSGAGVPTAAGTEGTSSTSNATLTNANYNQVTWVPVADAASYILVRTTAAGTPSTTGVIAQVPGDVAVFNDTGLVIIPNTSATVFFQRTAAPSTPTVTPGGTTGSTSYSYKVSAILPNGVWSAESAAGSTTTGNATLTSANNNKVTWTNITGATLYAIDRTVGGATTGLIGYAQSGTTGFVDTGLVATALTAQTAPNVTPPAGSLAAVALAALASSTSTPTAVAVKVG